MMTRSLVCSLALVLLAACSPAPAAAPTSTATRTPNAAPTATATPTEKDAPAPTLAGAACPESHGQVAVLEIDSQVLRGKLRFRVYTPPCYESDLDHRYPVLYLIHGQTFTDDQWDRLGADETADQLIAAGELAPFLIVMPYDKASAQPSVDPFGEAFIEELVPWVDANYRTIAGRDFRAVGGLSRGASWALHFAMLYPEDFGAVGGHSPPVFVEDATKVRGWLTDIPSELMPRIWLDIGDRDQEVILNSAEWLSGVLDENGIPHEWHLFSGTHSEAYWSSHVAEYLRWYAAPW